VARDIRTNSTSLVVDPSIACREFISTRPGQDDPYHLEQLTTWFDICVGGNLRTVVRVPIRHGKTTTALHAVALLLLRYPRLEIIYGTYSQQYAQRMSRQARRIYVDAGGKLSEDFNTLTQWQTYAGGYALFTSVDGPVTGQGAGLIIFDDLIKDRAEAESQSMRDRAFEWVTDVALGRGSPGFSVCSLGSRWHEDDPQGRMLAMGWGDIHLPAIIDEGGPRERALWPEKRDLEFLKARRAETGEYNWASQYQGDPRPREGTVFRMVRTYEGAPPAAMRIGIGVDFGYCKGRRTDWSSIVIMGEVGGVYYVVAVYRFKAVMSETRARLREVRSFYPGARVVSYVAGPERGVIDMLAEPTVDVDGVKIDGVIVEGWPARHSKFVRSIPISADWNAGKVRVDVSAPWAKGYLGEMYGFTGNEEQKDDQADATVGVYDLLRSELTATEPYFGGKRSL